MEEQEELSLLEGEGERPPPEFCLLLWAANKGRVGSNAGPIFSSQRTSVGYCAEPVDCFNCPLMQEEISKYPEGHAIWVCPSCIPEVIKVAQEKEIEYSLPAHYSEGQCQYVKCQRPAMEELVPSKTETPAHYSRLLQLFIGDVNNQEP